MARAHLSRSIVDDQGNLVPNATIRALKPGTTDPIDDTIYSSRTGSGERSNPWVVANGMADAYVNRAQTLRLGITPSGLSERFIEDLDVSGVATGAMVADFGAVGDGITDDTVALQAALDSMEAHSSMGFDGQYLVDPTTPLRLPTADGVTLWGAPGSNGRNSGATLLAKATGGAPGVAIMVSPEWYNNWAVGDPGKDAQGITISGLSFDGGHLNPSNPTEAIENASHADYGLIIHGSNHKLLNVFFNSFNVDGLLVAGNKGRDTTTTITETHEFWYIGGGIFNCGRDGFHAMPYAKDGHVSLVKVEYCARWAFWTDDNCAAWDFSHCHPSRCGSGFFHLMSGWDSNIDCAYLDSLGKWLGGIATPWRGASDPIVAIWVETSDHNVCHIHNNRGHTDNGGSTTWPVVLLHIKGWVVATYNTLMYETTDTSVTAVDDAGIPAWAFNVGNVAHS